MEDGDKIQEIMDIKNLLTNKIISAAINKNSIFNTLFFLEKTY